MIFGTEVTFSCESEILGKKTDISPRKKAVTECLIKEGRYSEQDIAQKLNISQTSVSRISTALKSGETHTVKRKGKCG